MHLGDKVFAQTTDFSSPTDSCSPSHPTKVSNLTEPTKSEAAAAAETTTAAFEKEERSYQRIKEFNAETKALKIERDATLATSSKCFEENRAWSSTSYTVNSAMASASLLGSNWSLASPAYADRFPTTANICHYNYSVRLAAGTVAATVPAHKPFTEHIVGEIISEATPLELMIMANDIIPQAHAEIEVRDTG